MADPVKLQPVETVFGIRAASRLMTEAMPSWIQDLGILVEAVEATRPPGAAVDWKPGAVLRLPFSKRLSRDGQALWPQTLAAFADAAMIVASSAAWNGYRPMNPIDQTVHHLRAASFDVLADARILRVTRAACFGQIGLLSAVDKRPVAMVSSVYAVV